MRHKRCLSFLVVFVFWLVLPIRAAAAEATQDAAGNPAQREAGKKGKTRQQKALEAELNRPLEEWVREDVAYIITDEEQQAFKRLQNAEEREQFVEQFWLRRDPTPDTEENEYKEEHYRRIAYANEHFASGISGWKTDRGRIYITFGPPDQVEPHSSGEMYQRPPAEGGGETRTFPFETWRYRHIPDVGDDVVIEFVDPTMTGEYRLAFDPAEKDALQHVPGWNRPDAPQRGDAAGSSSRQSPFERLKLLSDLHRAPRIKYRDLEAVVSSNISFKLFPFQVRVDYVRITSDTALAALTVQLGVKDIAFQNKDGVERGLVNIFGRVSTMTGRVVQTFEDAVAVDVPGGELPRYLPQSRVYWQAIPLRPGLYKLNLVLKDVNSGNLGTYTGRLQVPRYDDETLSASSLILADQIEKLPITQTGKGPFVIGSTRVRPRVGDTFQRSQQAGVYLQVYNLAADEKTHKPRARIEYTLLKDDRPVFQQAETSAEVANASRQMTLEKMIPVGKLEPGQYRLRVTISDELSGQTIAPTVVFNVQ